jgi:hypothetical protein
MWQTANKPAVWTPLPVYRWSATTQSWQESSQSIANKTDGVVYQDLSLDR